MKAVYQLQAEDLDEAFLLALKHTFPKGNLEISVRSSDDTDYLLSSPANRVHLLIALADSKMGRNLVVPDQTPFQKMP